MEAHIIDRLLQYLSPGVAQLSGARVPGMSLSSGEDEASRVRAESLGAVALLDKAEFGHELIPAILRLGAASKAADPSPTSERLPDVDLLGAGPIIVALLSPVDAIGVAVCSRRLPYSRRATTGGFIWSRVRNTSNPRRRVEKLAKLWPGKYVIVNRETGEKLYISTGDEMIH